MARCPRKPRPRPALIRTRSPPRSAFETAWRQPGMGLEACSNEYLEVHHPHLGLLADASGGLFRGCGLDGIESDERDVVRLAMQARYAGLRDDRGLGARLDHTAFLHQQAHR